MIAASLRRAGSRSARAAELADLGPREQKSRAVSIEHEQFMRRALEQAERARGTTGDNPWVGAVLVLDGDIIGEGHTHPPGSDHAEIAAIKAALAHGRAPLGATLYSTLEPCTFQGRTPACSLAIAHHRIARVVVGMRDPHPRVNGEGVRMLRAAGIEVVEGVLDREVAHSLAPWIDAYHPQARRGG